MSNINQLVREDFDPANINRRRQRGEISGLPKSALGAIKHQGGPAKVFGRPGLGYDPVKDMKKTEKKKLANKFNKQLGEKVL